MNRTIITLAALLLAAPAFAQINIGSGTQSASEAAAKAAQSQGLTNAPVMINEASQIPDNTTTTLRNVPSLTLPNIYPTSPCMGSTSVGGSGVGFSIGIGSSWKDDDCGKRETARAFAGMNMQNDAVEVLCSSPYAAAAPTCKAKAKAAQVETQKVADDERRKKDATEKNGDKRKANEVVAVQSPRECVSDEFIARRMGTTVCK